MKYTNQILISTMLFFNAACVTKNHRSVSVRDKASYAFTIKVISGSLQGEVYKGTFTYSINNLVGKDRQSIEVDDISFNCRGIKYDRNGFDSVPTVILKNGEFSDLVLVGGPHEKRFGINGGFNREQFNRPVEIFINEGKGYFGYLDADTFVDGAGVITYIPR